MPVSKRSTLGLYWVAAKAFFDYYNMAILLLTICHMGCSQNYGPLGYRLYLAPNTFRGAQAHKKPGALRLLNWFSFGFRAHSTF